MRIKILPLLLFVSTAGFLSGCVKQTETITPAVISSKVKEQQIEKKGEAAISKKYSEEKKIEKSKKSEKPLTVKLLKSSVNQPPKLKLVDYAFKNEVENFRKETGIEVVTVYPLYSSKIKNKSFVLLEEPDKVRIIVKDSYIFEFNRENIKNPKFLESLAKHFGKYLIVVSTYFDSSGSKQFNSYITERRADAIKNYLHKFGISNGNILAEGCGDKNPIAPNSSIEGRALNRRVEFYIYPAGAIVNGVCETR